MGNVITGGIPVPDPDFISHAVSTFKWDGDDAGQKPALVRHVLRLLAEWGWAEEVLEDIARERAGT